MRDISRAVNEQAAHLAALEFVVTALCRQVPDRARLLRDFEAMTWDYENETLNSMRAESFYQAFGASRSYWREQLSPPGAHPR